MTLNNIYLRENKTERFKELQRKYTGMKSRCNNKNSPDYKNYGGRGICIEDSFSTFQKFFDWALENGFEENKKLEIDRENNNGNYSSSNCRFVSHTINCRNMRKTVMTLELVEKIRFGEYKYLIESEVAKIIGCSPTTVQSVREYKTWKEVGV